MKPTRPALRYHGGKFRLAPWIISFFPDHRTYVVVLSGYPSDLYERLYPNWEKYSRTSSADCGKKRTEVVWLNEHCSDALRSKSGLFAELRS